MKKKIFIKAVGDVEDLEHKFLWENVQDICNRYPQITINDFTLFISVRNG